MPIAFLVGRQEPQQFIFAPIQCARSALQPNDLLELNLVSCEHHQKDS